MGKGHGILFANKPLNRKRRTDYVDDNDSDGSLFRPSKKKRRLQQTLSAPPSPPDSLRRFMDPDFVLKHEGGGNSGGLDQQLGMLNGRYVALFGALPEESVEILGSNEKENEHSDNDM